MQLLSATLPMQQQPSNDPDTVVADAPDTKCRQTAGEAGKIVCYGMVWQQLNLAGGSCADRPFSWQLEKLPIIRIPTATVIDESSSVHANLLEDNVIQRRYDGAHVGKLEGAAAKALSTLAQEAMVQLQLMITATPVQGRKRHKNAVVSFGSAIIYGPQDLANDVGDFLDKCNYCLHDPTGCERNVPYANPHSLAALFEDPVMTFEMQQPEEARVTFSVSASLRALQTSDVLPEFDQPAVLTTDLHRHQKQALWFFLNRETARCENPCWQFKKSLDGSSTYINKFSGTTRDMPPPTWRGGILDDEMGLGKTLEMISLIAASKQVEEQPQSLDPSPKHVSKHSMSTSKSTLIIVPVSVMEVWETQLQRFGSGAFRLRN
ncbi:Fc.00g113330.m01.CDS01 [Cosmosporella sp. VM-42]